MLLCINEADHTIDVYDETSRTLLKSLPISVSGLNIVKTLISAPDEVHRREDLIACGWPDKEVGSNSLNVSIMKLRRKLHAIDTQIEIRSYPTLGYKLELPSEVNVVHLEPNQHDGLADLLETSQNSSDLNSHANPTATIHSATPSIRWGDLFLSALILLYSSALYYSLYFL